MPVTATTNGFIFQIIDSLMESIASMYLLELKRGLSILLIFRLPGILPVWKRTHESRAATHETEVSKPHRPYLMSKKPQPLSCEAILAS